MTNYKEEEGEEVLMSPDEAILFLTDQLEDENVCAEAYREAAIALIDQIAEQAIKRNTDRREERRKRNEDLMNMHVPISTATH